VDIERTIEFILDQQAKGAAQLERQAEQLAKSTAEHDRRMAEHDRGMANIDRRLDRAIRLGVQEARAERKRRQEMDALEKITQLVAVQRVTEEKLQGLIDAMRRGGNGNKS